MESDMFVKSAIIKQIEKILDTNKLSPDVNADVDYEMEKYSLIFVQPNVFMLITIFLMFCPKAFWILILKIWKWLQNYMWS